MEDRWLSAKEVSEYLGVGRTTVYKWIARHDLPAHKAGRLWKFRRSEVDAWVTDGKTTPRTLENLNSERET